MKAAVVNAIGSGFDTEEISIAEPGRDEVLVDVRASGLCHTDLTYATTDIGYPPPAVLGHEAAGIVQAVGPGVTDVKQGDHVVGCLIQSCGKCRNCLSGFSYQCLNPDRTLRGDDDAPRLSRDGAPVTQGFGLGGFAEQALAHENQLVKVPSSMPFPQAALLGCGVVTGAGAVLNTANVQAGEDVAVLGAGGVGLNSISGALIAGAARIIAIDIADEKLETARSSAPRTRSTPPLPMRLPKS